MDVYIVYIAATVMVGRSITTLCYQLLIQSNRNSIPRTDVATCSCSGPQILCVLGGASEHRQCLAGAQDIRGTSNMVPESTATRHAPTSVRTTPRDQGRVQERGGVIQRTSTFNISI